MTLTHIAAFSLLALVYRFLIPTRWRGWSLLILSLLAIFWLQPALPIRQLDFFLPTLTLLVTVGCWLLVRQSDHLTTGDWGVLAVMALCVLALAATRYLAPELRLTTRPPAVENVLLALLLAAPGLAVLGWLAQRTQRLIPLSILAIIALFVTFKYEPLMLALSSWLRALQGQDVALAGVIDLGWLGFSYVAFRLIHTLRDRQTGVLPALNLREYVTYVIFFPAYIAGPIDRAERYVEDYRQGLAPVGVASAERIVIGLFKKFVLADTLALISLDVTSTGQATTVTGLWVLLYAYAFRLFFDFSGYTDIAIGIGLLFGLRLPENFDRPYRKGSITAFWQSWHMTLSNWVRFYVFSPLSRWLLSPPRRLPTPVILLISHLCTMSIIGLWHGITGPFLIWGLWHGLGLFIHKMWSDRTRKWQRQLKQRPRTYAAWQIGSVLLTFHFVLLGWVWFALPDMQSATQVFLRLFGVQP
jgi:alginate O-acetyltransferase complex protein AlgI